MRPFRLNLGALRDDTVRLDRSRSVVKEPGRVSAETAGRVTPFEIVDEGGRLAFWVDGQERWLIDPGRFGGTPLLKVKRGDDSVRISLSGAFYPGTNFSADFVGELRREGSVWRLHLSFALGDFQVVLPFVGWLSGREPARASVTLTSPPLPLGNRAGLVLRGKATAELSPDWALTLRGDRLGRFVGIGDALTADCVSLALLDRGAPSLLSHPAGRRTAIDLTALQGSWGLDLRLTTRDGWAFLSEGCPFDRVRVEASEPRVGPIVCALRAEATHGEPKLFCQPVGRGAAWEGLNLTLALARPRFAVAFEPSGNETALYADYANPAWRASHAGRRRVDSGSALKRLELLLQGGELTWLTSPPTLPTLLSPLVSEVVDRPSPHTAAHLAVGPSAEDAAYRPVGPEAAASAG